MQDITCYINTLRRIFPTYYTNTVIYSAGYGNALWNPGVLGWQDHCGSGMERGAPVRHRYLVHLVRFPALLARPGGLRNSRTVRATARHIRREISGIPHRQPRLAQSSPTTRRRSQKTFRKGID